MTVPKIALAYLHPGTVRAEFMDSVMRVVRFGPEVADISTISARSGADITRKRNEVFQHVANVRAFDYLWWVDSDVVFETNNILVRLLAHDLPIVAPLIHSQHDDGRIFPVFQTVSRQGDLIRGHYQDIPDMHKPFSVAGIGMYCTLISRPVLDALWSREPLYPYAEMDSLVNPDTRTGYGPTEDDITFCLRARAKGFETFVDPSITVGHVKDRVIWG